MPRMTPVAVQQQSAGIAIEAKSMTSSSTGMGACAYCAHRAVCSAARREDGPAEAERVEGRVARFVASVAPACSRRRSVKVVEPSQIGPIRAKRAHATSSTAQVARASERAQHDWAAPKRQVVVCSSRARGRERGAHHERREGDTRGAPLHHAGAEGAGFATQRLVELPTGGGCGSPRALVGIDDR